MADNIKKLKQALERIAKYAKNAQPGNAEQSKAMIAIIQQAAEHALEPDEQAEWIGKKEQPQ